MPNIFEGSKLVVAFKRQNNDGTAKKGELRIHALADGTIDIRHYYENAPGEMLPGKSGLVLSKVEAVSIMETLDELTTV
jgi:hypothetical protein